MAKKRRGLSPDESALWGRVADSARPLHPQRKKPVVKTPAPAYQPAPKPPPPPIAPFRLGETTPAAGQRHYLQPSLTARLATEPVRMDRKAYTRMARGKLKPQAKLDLHGLTLSDAQPELTGFILRTHAAGLRLVLVVTGKGRDRDDGGPIPAPRGALKHQVPMWLARPPLSGLVLQVTEAHRRHGGGGAYYVYLRRLNRPT